MQISVMRKERKYSFTIPFWVLSVEETSVWIVEVTLGIAFSNQMRSNVVRAVLKLVFSDFRGSMLSTAGVHLRYHLIEAGHDVSPISEKFYLLLEIEGGIFYRLLYSVLDIFKHADIGGICLNQDE